jgi:hypothetical protein
MKIMNLEIFVGLKTKGIEDEVDSDYEDKEQVVLSELDNSSSDQTSQSCPSEKDNANC